ncbi:hypothetical protein QI334_06545 [Staphylococcus saprophyticus]|nr:hypothetical protein [Staphylococcus saprophyticus]MDW3838597.1 hypothetical protein [Staphylococcus saprophyticus]MDW3914779.1 hypothetical protein [Staphylococcus saprophyticus]MDW3961942.1 hypothetical protein [Staphylococcus saprophyticus]MDW3980017.1 hypothetical protein [Staphylococcus saprophyticus]MDW4002393.1 hypothetical protein [Staphylococcus saprophyticus]
MNRINHDTYIFKYIMMLENIYAIKNIAPEVGRFVLAIIFISVVLPAPFFPIKPTTSPRFMVNETPSITLKSAPLKRL